MKIKTDMEEFGVVFTGVVAFADDNIFFTAILEDDFDENATMLYRWKGDQWAGSEMDRQITSLVPLNKKKSSLLCICSNGEFIVSPPRRYGTIDDTDRGPNELSFLACVRRIGGSIYAAGMARRVYKFDGENQWSAMDEGIYAPAEVRKQAIGILDIAGKSSKELVAVGYKGEIWFYDGRKWVQDLSPTNVALNAIIRTTNGNYFIVGLAGMILHGKPGAWTVFEQSDISDDFWSVIEFEENIYLSTEDSVYKISGESLQQLKITKNDEASFRFLETTGASIWAVGDRHIFRSSDGKKWFEIPPP